MRRILSEKHERLLAEERRWLSNLEIALARFGLAPEDQTLLSRSIHQLDELFLLVIVGEFNAGKSSFINALLGQKVLEEGVTPTTTRINLLKYGPEITRTTQEAGLDLLTAPVELLEEINIVDTPGTNAIQREHEALTQEFVPRSDLVLFVTSADRPFTESERVFMEQIRDWGKKLMLVINKIDILETQAQVAEVEAFVAENARRLLNTTPLIFSVSARQALRAKSSHDAALHAASRFDPLEREIVDLLDETERLRLKFGNPIGVGIHFIDQTLAVIEERLKLLGDDFQTIQDIERQLSIYREDMQRDFRFRLADVENVLHEFENRGMAYFDDTMRLARIFDLLNKPRLQEEYQRLVVQDVPQVIDQRVTEVIDWLVSSNLRQWEAVMEHINQRRTVDAERIIGKIGGTFDYDRDHLLATVGRAAQDVIESYDQEVEASQLADDLQAAVGYTAAVEIGAIGLGAALTYIFTTAALDVTGLTAAGLVAVMGLFVIPARRRQVKEDLHIKIDTMRENLMKALTAQFDQELDRGLRKLEEAIAPYTRFVRGERQNLEQMRAELEEIRGALTRLRAEIEHL